jgi:predicted acyltransferase
VNDAGVSATRSRERLLSLDALRGFDILWIVGGREVLQAWSESTGSPLARTLVAQTEHTPWHGFTAWDLIFPLFLFLAGVSTPFSFAGRGDRGDSRARIARRVARRGLVLVLLGLVYNGLLAFDWTHLRCASVLGRIGLAWMAAAWIALAFGVRGRIVWIAALLAGYWALLRFVPVPGYGAWNLEPGASLTDWFDRRFLPGRLYREVRDPEGLLGTLPAVATALFGVLAGEWLRSSRGGAPKVVGLALAGCALLALGAAWNLEFPINKNLWTSSFALWTAGWSSLLLAAFYLAFDVWRWRRLGFVFAVIGANSIAIYLAARFVDFAAVASFVFAPTKPRVHPILFAALPLAIEWLILWVLYQKKLFLRV